MLYFLIKCFIELFLVLSQSLGAYCSKCFDPLPAHEFLQEFCQVPPGPYFFVMLSKAFNSDLFTNYSSQSTYLQSNFDH